jgi:septum formation protein
LLRELGLPFEAVSSNADERAAQGGRPDLLAMDAARLKAEEVAGRLPNRLVLGADTVVYLDRQEQGECTADRPPANFTILGKPADPTEARAMLVALRNLRHGVVTGLCLIAPDRSVRTAAETTRVRMRDFSGEELERYLASGEPLDKAGAYGIQGAAAALIREIEGDYFNVVGLPLRLLVSLLRPWRAVDSLRIPPVPSQFACSSFTPPKNE